MRLTVDPNAILAVLNQRSQEVPVHVMHIGMLQILAKVHPLALFNFPLALDNLLGFRRERKHDINIRATEAERKISA